MSRRSKNDDLWKHVFETDPNKKALAAARMVVQVLEDFVEQPTKLHRLSTARRWSGAVARFIAQLDDNEWMKEV